MSINSKKVLKNKQGLPTKEQMVAGENTDNLLGTIKDPSTGEKAPASLTEGEYVFDIPSIIGLGQGDYNKGLKKLKQVHSMLQERGTQFMKQQQSSGDARSK